MKALLKKSAILKTISSKISTYLHAIDADPQEDNSDFDDEELHSSPYFYLSRFLYSFMVSFTTSSQLYFSQMKSAACFL